MPYIPLEINKLLTVGVYESLEAMRLPKNQEASVSLNEDLVLASKLIKAGTDHAKFTRGINVYLSMEMQVGWMIEFKTYRHGVEDLSTSSSMHNELSKLVGAELAEQKQKDLPEKTYRTIVVISYQAFRAIYKARRKHRHPDWQIFCDFIEELPYFKELIYPEWVRNEH